ncbi:MAG TPA: 50S ribosomal protein L6 [Candidatus Nanoarchaeia archaeon]|nr:50S ribosomal protein L6 [uncultured archaeon]
MSKIGKLPVKYEAGVQVSQEGSTVKVVGPKGQLTLRLAEEVKATLVPGVVTIERRDDSDRAKAIHGLTRTLVANMVEGVEKGFEKTLELSGVGFRASVEGQKLVLNIGFSHPVEVEAPSGISFRVAENKITVSGIDKALVGEIASRIRKVRKAEPYKGKGIKYEGEVIRRKAGKAAKAVGTA